MAATIKASSIKGQWSDVSGRDVRHVYDVNTGTLLAVIRKLESGGYRIYRATDGKVREKATLREAMKTARRSN